MTKVTSLKKVVPSLNSVAMGANLLANGTGAIFKTWAPAARSVRVRWDYTGDVNGTWHYHQEAELQRMEGGMWGGFVPGLQHGERYMFHVVGPEGGGENIKRDPYARDLTDNPVWPDCQCLLCDPDRFPWHDAGFRSPPYRELIIYQLHIGTWYIPQGRHHGTFLDVVEKLPYLKALGINAIQPLPVVEFQTIFSPGYNGVDYFSPETDYGIPKDDGALDHYLAMANRLLNDIDPQLTPYSRQDINGTANQLRMLVDLCHLHGIAVILDVVYSHAGGDFTENGLYFFDEQVRDTADNSLYFTEKGWAGGLTFAYGKDAVKQLLIDNALFYLEEYHADGFRYNEVSVILNDGGEDGWQFCLSLTDACHDAKPEAIHIAEHWPVDDNIVYPTIAGGAGFDAIENDGLREALRSVLEQAASGDDTFVDISRIARELEVPQLNEKWRAIQCTENHYNVYRGRGWRTPRIADSDDSRSWQARSRSRVVLGLIMTAPGIPRVFMGQEFLEDKQWCDIVERGFQINWDGLSSDKSMADFLRFSQDLFATRRRYLALCSTGLNVYHHHNKNRVLAYHRWVPGQHHHIVVVVSFSDVTYNSYRLGFPHAGHWSEVFNSDAYDNWINPRVHGNGGSIDALDSGLHDLPASAQIVLPANSILIFAKD